MLNLFPIQWLSLVAYCLLRVGVGSIFLYLAYTQVKHWKDIPARINLPLIKNGRLIVSLIIMCELIIGTLYIIGLTTQIAALLSITLCIKMIIWHRRFPTSSIPDRLSYILIVLSSLSLLITGAGAIAVDLPI